MLPRVKAHAAPTVWRDLSARSSWKSAWFTLKWWIWAWFATTSCLVISAGVLVFAWVVAMVLVAGVDVTVDCSVTRSIHLLWYCISNYARCISTSWLRCRRCSSVRCRNSFVPWNDGVLINSHVILHMRNWLNWTALDWRLLKKNVVRGLSRKYCLLSIIYEEWAGYWQWVCFFPSRVCDCWDTRCYLHHMAREALFRSSALRRCYRCGIRSH